MKNYSSENFSSLWVISKKTGWKEVWVKDGGESATDVFGPPNTWGPSRSLAALSPHWGKRYLKWHSFGPRHYARRLSVSWLIDQLSSVEHWVSGQFSASLPQKCLTWPQQFCSCSCLCIQIFLEFNISVLCWRWSCLRFRAGLEEWLSKWSVCLESMRNLVRFPEPP